MTRLSNCDLSLLFLITTGETKNKSFLRGGTEWGEGLSFFHFSTVLDSHEKNNQGE